MDTGIEIDENFRKYISKGKPPQIINLLSKIAKLRLENDPKK
jgi:hypothetical protein